jgi:PadR family transcriptional regulator, regulatory protein AphA
MPGDLTTTSYAILGLLGVRPWTPYELAQQMDRSLGQFWPRARSKIYEEPKKLVAHGLATASNEAVGKRPRTVYSITPAGRKALRAWVKTPVTSTPTLDLEHLIRVFFAEHGTKADLQARLDELRAWTDTQAQLGVEISGPYLDGTGPFPERLPWLVLVGRFLDDFEKLVLEWTTWAAEVIGDWPDDVTKAQPDIAALQAMARRNAEIVHRGD